MIGAKELIVGSLGSLAIHGAVICGGMQLYALAGASNRSLVYSVYYVELSEISQLSDTSNFAAQSQPLNSNLTLSGPQEFIGDNKTKTSNSPVLKQSRKPTREPESQQTLPGTQPFAGLSGEMVAAQLLEQVNPEIPTALRHSDFKARVRVKLQIDNQGHSVALLTESSGNKEIDRRLEQALSQWKWKPAELSGQKIASEKYLQFEFVVQ